MTAAQLRKMNEGRARVRRQHERDALARVRAYLDWLPRARCLPDGTWPRVPCPGNPSDADFAIARRLDPTIARRT